MTKKEREQFEHYRPVSSEDLSTRELRVGEWWVKKQGGFRNALIGVLLFIGVGGIGLGLYTIGEYFIVGQSREAVETRQLLRPKVPFAQYHESLAPADPVIERVQVLAATGDQYDFVTIATNPNPNWYVEMTYNFVFDSRETEFRTIQLVPGQRTVVSELGYETTRRPGSAVIQVSDVKWFRVSNQLTLDPETYIVERSNLVVGDVSFIPGVRGEAETELLEAHRAQFTITNDTAYNFWTVPVYVLLYNGSSLRAVARTEMKSLQSGEKREGEIRLFNDSLNVNNVEVFPYVPVFDESIYQPQ